MEAALGVDRAAQVRSGHRSGSTSRSSSGRIQATAGRQELREGCAKDVRACLLVNHPLDSIPSQKSYAPGESSAVTVDKSWLWMRRVENSVRQNVVGVVGDIVEARS